MPRFTVYAEYPYSEPPEEIATSIVVEADHHRQHIYTHTVLVGVSKSGAERIDTFLKLHPDAEVRVDVPGGPLLDHYERN